MPLDRSLLNFSALQEIWPWPPWKQTALTRKMSRDCAMMNAIQTVSSFQQLPVIAISIPIVEHDESSYARTLVFYVMDVSPYFLHLIASLNAVQYHQPRVKMNITDNQEERKGTPWFSAHTRMIYLQPVRRKFAVLLSIPCNLSIPW